MSTTLQIELSSAMQTWLAQGGAGNGVSAYAILYGSATAGGSADTPLASVTLAHDGVVSGGSFSMALTSASQADLYGGKVYFIIQSSTDPSDAIDPTTLSQSAITWANAQSLDYRYDSIEVSLTGSTGDAANLTSIEGFGIGMTLSAKTGSRSYATSAADLFTLLANAAVDPVSGMPAVTSFASGGLQNDDREAVSPAVAVVPSNAYPLYAPGDWTNYIAALKRPETPIVINGYFNGAADLQAGAPAGTDAIWRNAGFFSYVLEWREAEQTFWLLPTEGSQIAGAIKLSPDQLAQSVYSTLGTVELYETVASPTPFEIYPGTTQMNVGANNAWGQVMQQLTLGLTAGYLQSTGTSPNAADPLRVDLNKNYNWNPTYAYGEHTHSALGGDVTLRWDPYSEIFFANSNSYGTQYADALMNAFAQGGPQLPTYANGANVSTLTVKLFADTETPPPGDYTPPVIHDYVAPDPTTHKYEAVTWYDNNPANITLNFNPGSSLAQSLVLRDDVSLIFRVLTGYDGDTPRFQDVAIHEKGHDLWQTWTFAHDGGTYSVSASGGAEQTSQSLVLTGLPMPASGVGWYQILVRAPRFEKVFNLYTTTNTPDGASLPVFSDFGSDPALFGVDGLATLTPGATTTGGLLTFSVDVTGVSPTLDLSLMQANTTHAFLAGQTTATAPVAGLIDRGSFTALAGQTADVHDSQGNGVDLSVTSPSGMVAFGWTGLNDGPDASGWTESFTNLIQAHAVARLHVADSAGHAVGTLYARADLAGGWHTARAQQLGNGTYTVAMTAYAAKPDAPFQPDLLVPLTKESAVLTVTVALSELAIVATTEGTALELLPDGHHTAGNWIRFAAAAHALPKGSSVVLYGTDAAGRLVDADGRMVGTVEEAALGHVGTVGSDGGTTLMDGVQSVYLAAGRQLHFALIDGPGRAPREVPVTIEDLGGGNLSVALGDITLDAHVQNTLSAEAQMASTQRMYDVPMVHLAQGQAITVALAGSADNVNTLGFVRLDVDQGTGALSIRGIAYGDSDAFRDVVRDTLDTGYSATVGHGDFAESATWTVAGETGYYAPVLITQSGEIFLPGSGNAGGHDYIRIYGENTFGFEDLSAAQGGDFDYNDLVMRLAPMIEDLAV